MHEFYHIHSSPASDAEPAAGGGLWWGCAQAWTKLVPGGKSSRAESLLPTPSRGAARGAWGSGTPPQGTGGQGPGPAEPPALQSPRPRRHHPGVAQGLRIFCLGNANLTFQL